jgi:hypothetical protein
MLYLMPNYSMPNQLLSINMGQNFPGRNEGGETNDHP